VNPGTVIGLEHLEGSGETLQVKFLFYAPPGQQLLDVIQ